MRGTDRGREEYGSKGHRNSLGGGGSEGGKQNSHGGSNLKASIENNFATLDNIFQ